MEDDNQFYYTMHLFIRRNVINEGGGSYREVGPLEPQ